MRETELWRRLGEVLPAGYVRVWAEQVVLTSLGRTVSQALADGVDCKTIWRAAHEQLELSESLR